MIKITPYVADPKNNVTSFEHKNSQKEKPAKKNYNDPLNQWPARGFAYSNELGAAISEVAPKLGTLLWVPALLYFGADIYDKYKNDKTSFDPSKKRGTEQAIFQLLASVILPTAAVLGGQKIASAVGSLDKTGLSLQSREEISNYIQDFMSRRHLDDFKNNKKEFKSHFEESLITKREKLIRETKFKQPFTNFFNSIFNRRHPEAMALSQKDRVMKYADENINKIFELHQKLMNNEKPAEFSDKLFKKFQKIKAKLAKDPDFKETYLRDATEDIIKKYQKSKIMNAKMLKTLGGFIALGLAIKPIDNFVEKVIMKKYVEPGFSKMAFDNSQVKAYKEKVLTENPKTNQA